MLRIQINASRRPRERPGRSDNGFQEKLRLSARMPAVFCARSRYEAFFYTAWANRDILHCSRTGLFDHPVGRLIGRDISAGSSIYLLEAC